MNLYFKFIFSLCFIVFIAYCENYLSPCSVNKPFLLFDSTCGSFEDVCVKKGDLRCDNLMNSCQQCPSTNYSIPMILDTLRMMKSAIYENRQNQTDDRIQTIKTEIYENRQNLATQIQSLKILNIFLIVIVIILFILMMLMIRMRKITEGIRRMKRKNKGDLEITTENQITPLLKSRKIDNLENFAKQIKNQLDELKSEIIKLNTNYKKLDGMESIKELLNDQFNNISSEILSIRSKIESIEMKKTSSDINLKGIIENHDSDCTASSPHVEVNPISETTESQLIGDDITRISSEQATSQIDVNK